MKRTNNIIVVCFLLTILTICASLVSFSQETKKKRRAWLYNLYCPGCRAYHRINISEVKFNGSYDRPSLDGEIKYWSKNTGRCRFTLEEGIIYYGNDCGHELASESVPVRIGIQMMFPEEE